MNRILLSFILATMAACDASDDNDAGDEGGAEAGSDEGGAVGECDDTITECALGALSVDQFADYCDLVLVSISAEPGDRFECMESGLYLDIATQEQCLATMVSATCSVTVGESISCYKAAELDACEAFADECAVITDPETGCWG